MSLRVALSAARDALEQLWEAEKILRAGEFGATRERVRSAQDALADAAEEIAQERLDGAAQEAERAREHMARASSRLGNLAERSCSGNEAVVRADDAACAIDHAQEAVKSVISRLEARQEHLLQGETEHTRN
jgi:hypothetical protein